LGLKKVRLKGAAKHFELLSQKVVTETEKGLRDTLIYAYDQALKLSAGSLTYSEMKRAGYPYAQPSNRPGMTYKGKPWAPAAHPEMLNMHSKKFIRGWEKSSVTSSSSSLHCSLYNNVPYSKYFNEDIYPNGTAKMVARPIISTISNRVKDDLWLNVGARLERYF
jgi:hypothetical protein